MRLSPLAIWSGLRTFRYLRAAPEPLDAGFLQQEQERRAAAVHDRHFALTEFDDDVVDAGGHERGQQVLDRFNRGAVAAEHRGVLHGRHVFDGCRNLDAQVGPAEPDAGIGRRGLERERHLLAGMKSDPGA